MTMMCHVMVTIIPVSKVFRFIDARGHIRAVTLAYHSAHEYKKCKVFDNTMGFTLLFIGYGYIIMKSFVIFRYVLLQPFL